MCGIIRQANNISKFDSPSTNSLRDTDVHTINLLVAGTK